MSWDTILVLFIPFAGIILYRRRLLEALRLIGQMFNPPAGWESVKNRAGGISWGCAWLAIGFFVPYADHAPFTDALAWGLCLGAMFGTLAYFGPLTIMVINTLWMMVFLICAGPILWIFEKFASKR
jgi:hypothetical protein